MGKVVGLILLVFVVMSFAAQHLSCMSIGLHKGKIVKKQPVAVLRNTFNTSELSSVYHVKTTKFIWKFPFFLFFWKQCRPDDVKKSLMSTFGYYILNASYSYILLQLYGYMLHKFTARVMVYFWSYFLFSAANKSFRKINLKLFFL